MKRFLIGGAAAVAILAGGAAVAQTAKPATAHAPRAHAAQPTTRAQVQSQLATMFAKLDTNHDGAIAKDELSAMEAKRDQKFEQRAQRFDPSKAFDRIDLNHDGKITTAEAEAAHSQHAKTKGGKPAKAQAAAFSGLFARADANKDGVITKAEFDTMGQQIKARIEKAGERRDGMATRMFNMADANKDGRVSLAEMQQAALARFDRVDANRDGTITPAERKAARQERKAQNKS
jgi:Ca2+-binding EF-hand superfamily protein